ncbi:MAG TPA: hypothetical protein VF414_02170 [Thermoanaerobaculia bacterium]
MRQFQNMLGLLAGAVLALSSAAHSVLGWKQMQSSLAATNAPPDLVQGLRIGWLFGGVAILTFGCIALAVFASRLRGRAVPLLPTALIALAYLWFGAWALVTSGNPFFYIFIVPGAMLAIASLPSRAG